MLETHSSLTTGVPLFGKHDEGMKISQPKVFHSREQSVYLALFATAAALTSRFPDFDRAIDWRFLVQLSQIHSSCTIRSVSNAVTVSEPDL